MSSRFRIPSRRGTWHRSIAVWVAVTMLATVIPATVSAEEITTAADPYQVSNLTATQSQGFTTLAWTPVAGASSYDIERTPVNAANTPTGAGVITGVWRPDRQLHNESPTFADAGFNPGDRFGWRVRARLGTGLPNIVTIDAPSVAAGVYEAAGAAFGPALNATGFAGDIVLVTGSTGVPSQGCGVLLGFPAGAIAAVDRGTCTFVEKVKAAQNAGAIAVIVLNNTGGTPATMTGTDATIVIPSVLVSQVNGNLIRPALPATGRVASYPVTIYSEYVYGTTDAPWGDPAIPGQNLRTQWETSLAAQFTSDVNEYAYEAAIASMSPRVRIVEIGRTVLNRPINMFVIGYPTPKATAEEVAATNPPAINCNVHGNEPSDRESCFILARQLAFSDDARVIDILSNTNVLIIPTINGDGRAANTRGNSTGEDLNRDYSQITQPETFAYVKMLRDYKPVAGYDGHEFGNNSAGDLPMLPPRHQNVAQSIFDESQNMIVGHMYEVGSTAGWWPCPYGCAGGGSVGLSEETILRNNLGLKNVVNSLLELRSAGGTTRPNETATANNRRRKSFSGLWTFNAFLDYHRANLGAILGARDEAIAFQISNTGRIVFRGSRPIPVIPAPSPGQDPPPADAPPANLILNDPPCGYRLTEAQYNGPRTDGPVGFRTTLAERIAAHGWAVEHRPTGHIVRMAQPERGLIPLLLDSQAVEELTSGVRLYECPYIVAASSGLTPVIVEGNPATGSVTISNTAVEPNQPLNWTITEAVSSCASPSDLPWVSTSATDGSTATSSSTTVDVTFDSAAPDEFSGVLCLASNDPGEPLIVLPISLKVLYPFVGFLSPVGSGLNVVEAGSNVPVKFRVNGQRTSAVLAAGYPVSIPVDCTTFVATGAPVATNSGSGLVWSTDKYQYDWKTVKTWKNSCRELVIVLDDGTTHTALFRFMG